MIPKPRCRARPLWGALAASVGCGSAATFTVWKLPLLCFTPAEWALGAPALLPLLLSAAGKQKHSLCFRSAVSCWCTG